MTFNILVPVYNVEKYIDECINSVLNQTYKKFRLILVDDGSTDRSGEICDEYAGKDNRVIVIHQKNMGLLACRRTAINYVKNNFSDEELAVFLDSDDYLELNALEIIKDIIEKNQCDMVIYGMQSIYDGRVAFKYSNDYIGDITNKRDLYKTVFFNDKYNSLWRKAVKCSLLENTDYSNYYSISNGEDLLQSIPLLKKCKKASFIDNILYNYRCNPNSITRTFSLRRFQNRSTVRKEVLDFLYKENVFSEDDFIEYFKYCYFLIFREVLEINSYKISRKEKNDLFDEISENEYFSYILNQSKTPASKFILNKKHNLLRIWIFWYRVRRKVKILVKKNG